MEYLKRPPEIFENFEMTATLKRTWITPLFKILVDNSICAVYEKIEKFGHEVLLL